MVVNGDGDCNSPTLFWIQSPSTRPQKMTLLNLEVQDLFIFGPFTTATGCFLMILMPQSLTGHRWCHEWIGSSATRCRVFQFLLPTGAVFESDWGDLKGTSVLTWEVSSNHEVDCAPFQFEIFLIFWLEKMTWKNRKSLTQNLWSMMLSKTRISSFWPLFNEVYLKFSRVWELPYCNMAIR